MQTNEFEWDDDKAASNLAKHGISFGGATFSFDDSDGRDILDEAATYGEHRFRWIGWAGQRLLAVTNGDRGPKRRISSA